MGPKVNAEKTNALAMTPNTRQLEFVVGEEELESVSQFDCLGKLVSSSLDMMQRSREE